MWSPDADVPNCKRERKHDEGDQRQTNQSKDSKFPAYAVHRAIKLKYLGGRKRRRREGREKEERGRERRRREGREGGREKWREGEREGGREGERERKGGEGEGGREGGKVKGKW